MMADTLSAPPRPICPRCLSPLDRDSLRPLAGRHCRARATGRFCSWAGGLAPSGPDTQQCPIPHCGGGPLLLTQACCPAQIDLTAQRRARHVAVLSLDHPATADIAVATLAALLRLAPQVRAAPAAWREVAAWSPARLRGAGMKVPGDGPFRLRLDTPESELHLHRPERDGAACPVAARHDPASRAMAADDLVLAASAATFLQSSAPHPGLRWLAELEGAAAHRQGHLPSLWLLLTQTDLWQRHAGWTGPVAPMAMEGVIRRVLAAEQALGRLLALPWPSVRFVTTARPLAGDAAAPLADLVAPLAGPVTAPVRAGGART